MDQSLDQGKSGKSPVVIVLIIIGVLVIAAAMYFIVFARGVSKSVVSNVIPLNSTCKYNDPDLCKFVNGWKDVKYYTADSTTTFEGKQVKYKLESVGEDRTHMVSYSGSVENMNIISIGDDTYMKDYSDNTWTKTTRSPNDENIVKNDLEFDEKAQLETDKTEYKKIGKEPCGKFTCFKYQVIDPAIPDSTEFILFDDKQYQLRKTISIGPDNNQATTEFDYSKITIDVPSPVKEVPASPEIPSQQDVERALEQISAE